MEHLHSRLIQSNLQALLNNQVPAIRIPDFATPKECERLIESLNNIEFHSTDWNPETSLRFGPSYFEYREKGKAAYFETAHQYTKLRQKIVSNSFDPMLRLAELIQGQANTPIEIACEPKFGNYFAGSSKQRVHAPLHTDSSEMMKGWVIGTVINQLTWNVYLNVPEENNSTVVYNKQWQVEDNQFMTGIDDYTDEVVAGVERLQLQPALGEVILFNSWNYHRVPQLGGTRITMGSFLGQTPEGKLIYWS